MIAGGTVGGTILSYFQTIDRWVALNRCNITPVMTDLPDIANDDMTVKQRVYSGGANGSEVVSYVVQNGGHSWPQGCQYLGGVGHRTDVPGHECERGNLGLFQAVQTLTDLSECRILFDWIRASLKLKDPLVAKTSGTPFRHPISNTSLLPSPKPSPGRIRCG